MSAVRAYVVWRLKENINIKKEELLYFSSGGYSFTNKDGKHISFDFEESSRGYIEEDRLIECHHKEIDNDLITSILKEDKYNDLIQEQYDINFFRNGKLNIESDEFHCCMDLKINNELLDEVDFREYIEPVYLAVFDPHNTDDDIELYNKLTEEEYSKYIN